MQKKILLPAIAATALFLGFLLGYTIYDAAPSDGFMIEGERETGISPEVFTLPEGSKININTATAVELIDLPGIGPSLSRRILEYRKIHGSFESIEELLNVSGIGPKVFEKLEPYVTVGGN